MTNKQVFRRGLVLAVIATMVLSTAIFGITKIYSVSSHINKADGGYTKAPTTQMLRKDIGVAATIPPAFSNAFTYEVGYVAQTEQTDEEGKVLSHYQSFSAQYVRNAESLFLGAEDASKAGSMTTAHQQVFDCGGVSVNYFTYTTKVAPPDYVKTEEEKAAEAAGTLQFAYAGGNEITTEQTQILWWQEEGVLYTLSPVNSTLTAQGLIEMAAEIIEG